MYYRSAIITLFLTAILLVPRGVSAGTSVKLVSSPALSPDGSEVAFSWRGDIWTVPIQGGPARQVTTDESTDAQPAFSPDGKHLAFISNRTGSNQVHMLPVTGGKPQQLTYHTEGYSLHEWFPNGQALLTSASRDHFWRHSGRFFQIRTKPRTGEQLLFDAHGRDATISLDGKQVLFTREGTRWWRKNYKGAQAGQVWLYTLATGKFKKVVEHPLGCRNPLWAPNGKEFYYVSGQSGAFNLWQRDLNSIKETQLTEFPDDSVTFPCIARNGSMIVFRHLFDLYSVKPGDGKAPKKINITYAGDEARDPILRRTLRTATDVAFSKDGLEVAFIAGGDVWIMDTELREPKQVTNTSEEERDILFAPDGNALLFVSDKGHQCDIWKATRENADAYWWQNDTFPLKRLTNDTTVESNLRWSPAGDQVAFVKSAGDLWIMKPDGGGAKRILSSWDEPDYDWSPDGKWMVHALSDNDFNRDIFVVPLDGSREPFNLSFHPDNDRSPVWSPDGSMIAFTGRRIGAEVDIYYVYLQASKNEEDRRDRKIQKAIEKIKKVREAKSGPASGKPEEKTEKEAKSDEPKKDEPKKEDPKKNESKKPDSKKTDEAESAEKDQPVVIDFEGIHDRVRRISIADSQESGLFWSHDSKKLAFSARIDGKTGVHTVSFPDELKPKLLTEQTGTSARWISQGNQILWLQNGVPTSVAAETAKSTSYSFSVRQATDVATRYETAFMQCWRLMRDVFYDQRLNNRNWDAIYRKYAPMARDAVDMAALSDVINLMLGELNGSHLGAYMGAGMSPFSPAASSASDTWNDTTAHLGLRFDSTHKGPGLKVRDVIFQGPSDKAKTKISPGEVVLSINEMAVDPDMDMTTVLNGNPDRDIKLKVRSGKGEERDVTIRPTTYSAVRGALYEMWVRHNRELVSKASEGKLGYLHIRGMNMTSFYRFEQELYEVGAGKDGLVIDVRENGGGSTTDHLLTALTQPDHAITVPRGGGQGYPHDRRIYATWNKPIVVLCNQNSFSNAEIFSHAIKTLKRGRLVGVPTSGSVISTGGTNIMDMGFLRLPFRGWFLLGDGQDMELNGAVPHVIVWPLPGEMPAGKDRQLERAIAMLKADVKKWLGRPRPELRTAAQKRAAGE